MTLQEIKKVLLKGDPDIQHYTSRKKTADYTVWKEYRQMGITGGDHHEEGWCFQVDRFTRKERDPVTENIRRALEAEPAIAFSHEVDYEQDTGYIHHIFDCEGC